MRILTWILVVSTLISACDQMAGPESTPTRPTFDLGYETSRKVTTTVTWQPEIRDCGLEDLAAHAGPGEGGAGRIVFGLAFHNISSTRCRLVDPVALEVVGPGLSTIEVTLRRRGPEAFVGPLDPGKRAIVAITYWKCPAIHVQPRPTTAFRVVFPKNEVIRVPYEVPANCGFTWYGRFSDWK